MATVTSLTKWQIEKMTSGWETVAQDQTTTNEIIGRLQQEIDANQASLNELKTVTMPNLEAELAAGAIGVSDLRDTIVPNLEADISRHELELQNVQTVDIPALKSDVDFSVNEVVTMRAEPKSFYQDVPPLPPDPETEPDARPLQLEDRWFAISEGYKQYRWDGGQWVEAQVSIPDFSLTVKKFYSTNHAIY